MMVLICSWSLVSFGKMHNRGWLESQPPTCLGAHLPFFIPPPTNPTHTPIFGAKLSPIFRTTFPPANSCHLFIMNSTAFASSRKKGRENTKGINPLLYLLHNHYTYNIYTRDGRLQPHPEINIQFLDKYTIYLHILRTHISWHNAMVQFLNTSLVVHWNLSGNIVITSYKIQIQHNQTALIYMPNYTNE